LWCEGERKERSECSLSDKWARECLGEFGVWVFWWTPRQSSLLDWISSLVECQVALPRWTELRLGDVPAMNTLGSPWYIQADGNKLIKIGLHVWSETLWEG
jgi:hypothetical protein